MEFILQRQAPEDAEGIEALMDRAFGAGRKRRTVHAFRETAEPLPGLGFVARDRDGVLLGSVRFWPAALPDGATEPLLGPLAVDPVLRGLGVGRALVRRGLAEAQSQDWGAVLIVGDPGYYAPLGFRVDLVARMDLPGPVAPLSFMGLELREGRLDDVRGAVTPIL